MRSSRSSFSKIAFGALVAIIALTGCAGRMPQLTADAAVATGVGRIAVLPIDNLSGGPAPVKALRQELVTRLQASGLTVLPDADLDAFMARRRLRYVGGVTREDAAAFRLDARVDAMVVTSLELYNES
ncbi:MAG TPA: hypothetical protein VIU40_05275, partial [Geobacteraceae bacterium]